MPPEMTFVECERFLSGHGMQKPRAVLGELAEEAGPDEEPDRHGEGSLINDFERDIADLLGKDAAMIGANHKQASARSLLQRTAAAEFMSRMRAGGAIAAGLRQARL